MTHVAIDAGYHSASAFISAFRREYGLTPGVVRSRSVNTGALRTGGLERPPASPNMVEWRTNPIEDERKHGNDWQRFTPNAAHSAGRGSCRSIARGGQGRDAIPRVRFSRGPAQPVDRFVYVEEGEIEVVNPYTDERHLPSTLGPTQFMGEISFLNGGAWSMAMRAVRDTRVIEVPREAMLTLMSQIPEMSDIIITVFSARRRRQLEERTAACG